MAQYGLGRGLEALIPKKVDGAPAASAAPIATMTVASGYGLPLMVAVGSITVNDYQPRRDFAEHDLAELADSVREYGIIQPLVVSKQDDGYRLIAGERRLRAAKIAGLSQVPVVIRNADEAQRAVVAIIENIQRVDLNPIETALAYQQLMDEFGLTQEEVARKMGKSRPGIANTLRYLKLHPDVQQAMRSGALQEGHGKVLAGLSLDEQAAMLPQILEEGMTVARAADAVKSRAPEGAASGMVNMGTLPLFDPSLAAKEELLRDHFGTKVNIQRKKKGGTITIEFYSDDELRGILNKIIT